MFLTRPHGQVCFAWIHHGILRGGYPVLFLLLFCCGLGLPLPEDIPLIVSGILVQNGDFSLGTAALVAWCGIIGGDCMLYLLGMKFGHDIVSVPIVGRGITAKRLAMLESWFVRWGIWVVAVGRMFAGVRGAMVVVAGASKFNFWKFIVADGIAAIVSGGLFLLLGYKFAQHHGAASTPRFYGRYKSRAACSSAWQSPCCDADRRLRLVAKTRQKCHRRSVRVVSAGANPKTRRRLRQAR